MRSLQVVFTILIIGCFSLCSGLVFGQEEEASPPKLKTFYWVFFNKGSGREKLKGMTPQAIEKMQADHIANLERLGNSGRAIAAGPLGDNGFIRGIVVLTADSLEKVRDCFKDDPYVQNDILAVEAIRLRADTSQIGKPDAPFTMALHTIGIVKRGSGGKPSSQALVQQIPSLRKWDRAGDLVLVGDVQGESDKLGVLCFRSGDLSQVQSQLAQDPAIRSGRIQVELHPQYLASGVFGTLSAASPPPSKNRTALFDGATLSGWEGDTGRTWRVEKRAIVGGSLTETVPHNDFLVTTKEYRNFDLRLKVKLVGTGFVNAGIQFRSQRQKTPPTYEMVGFQADMGEGYWGSLYDESRRNRTLFQAPTERVKAILKENDWNTYVIRCEGRRIRLWLNGTLTVDYSEPDGKIPLMGYIGLQIHGGGKAQAFYKDISLEELP